MDFEIPIDTLSKYTTEKEIGKMIKECDTMESLQHIIDNSGISRQVPFLKGIGMDIPLWSTTKTINDGLLTIICLKYVQLRKLGV